MNKELLIVTKRCFIRAQYLSGGVDYKIFEDRKNSSMNVISRCIQDIIKYWNECWWMIVLAAMGTFVMALGIRMYRRKAGLECLVLPVFYYRLFIWLCNSVYFVYAFYITFGMRYVGERREVQRIPFDGVWERPWEYPLLLENVLLFVPFGILMPLTWTRFWSGKMVGIGAFVVSVIIEVAQYVFRCGKTEVDDVILNCMGAMIGYGVFMLGRKIRCVSK